MSKKIIGILSALAAFSGSLAAPQGLDGKLKPRVVRSIDAQSAQLVVKGFTIEVIKNKRVNERLLASGELSYEVISSATQAEELSEKSPVLVFNHGLGEYGLMTGEITFKFRNPESFASFPTSEFRGFTKVGNLDVYSVQAPSPDEFVLYVKKLALRKDLLWFEPTVRYVPDIRTDKGRF